jgi:hypothetical protein
MKEATLKHFVERLRPVFDDDRYSGALIYGPRGWVAHHAAGNWIGEYGDDAQAVALIHFLLSPAPWARPSAVDCQGTAEVLPGACHEAAGGSLCPSDLCESLFGCVRLKRI